MKKVSILALHLGYGGIEKCISVLANLLCTRYQVEIAVCYKILEEPAFHLDERVKVIYLNDDIKPNREAFINALKKKNPVKVLKEGSYSMKVLYRRKKYMCDYIRNCNSNVIISTKDIFNYWTCSYAHDGVIKIGWEHNHYHKSTKYATNMINSAKNLDYFVLVSSDLQKFYSSKLVNSKVMCIYIPNAIESIPNKVSSLKDKRLISVGRLSHEKGFIDLLKVYNVLQLEYPDWCLDIVGDGVERGKLEEYIKKHHLDNVTLHGFQGKEYIDELLNKSSIYVMTSFTESFGIVLLEAMSHGVPCIAYDSAEGAREIINSGDNGFLIKNRNLDAMVLKIRNLIENEKLRKNVGKAARESINKYTNEVVGEEWFTLIEESDIYE